MSDSKTIGKNTLLLYFRMFIIMGVSLYTSRIVLNTLGIEDFGIYNVVGGVVILFSFISSAMTSGTQRFLSFEIGRNNISDIAQVFSASIKIHFYIAIIIVLLAETIGLWFLNYKLNIPSDRIKAANFVYQLSLVAFIFNIIRTPYVASILAYEKMSFYSWISIIEVFLKLAFVGLLLLISFDKLILYSVFTSLISIIVFIIYYWVVLKKIPTCTLVKNIDSKIKKQMIQFSGWAMIGHISLVGSNQGISMIINLFIGVVANAALGIAGQVNTAIYSFVSNFQIAFNPQITKSYSTNQLKEHTNLVVNASVLSFYLIFLLSVPILFYTGFVLELWLKKVPEYTVEFTQIVLLISFIDALSGPYWVAINATGKVKVYQIGVSLVLFLNLPVAYLLLMNGFSPIIVMISKLFISILLLIYRFIVFKKGIEISFDKTFFRKYLRLFLVCVVTILTVYLFKQKVLSGSENIFNFILFSMFYLLILITSLFSFGLDKQEKKKLRNLIFNK